VRTTADTAIGVASIGRTETEASGGYCRKNNNNNNKKTLSVAGLVTRRNIKK